MQPIQSCRFPAFAAAAVALLALAACGRHEPPPALDVSSLSAPRNIVTGDDALIAVSAPPGVLGDDLTVSVNGNANAARFKAAPSVSR